jgi:signal transduction histidine kinase
LIAAGRAAVINAWLAERKGDAEVLADDPLVLAFVSHPDARMRATVVRVLNDVRQAYGYNALLITDARGRSVAAAEPTFPSGDLLHDGVDLVSQPRGFEVRQLIDAHGRAWLLFKLPLTAGGREGRFMGNVVMSSRPDPALFAQLSADLSRSQTGGAILLERGVTPDVMYPSPLPFRTPSGHLSTDVLKKLSASEGFREATDDRGTRIFVVSRAIPQTNWMLLERVARKEALGDFTELAAIEIVSVLLLGAAVTCLFLIQRRRLIMRALQAELAESQRVLELERRLRESQKLEAMGRLASGVAHDFNNLLTIIGANAALLLEGLPASNSLREPAQEINTASQLAADFTARLLAFGRRQAGASARRSVDLNDIVSELTPILRRSVGRNIELVTELDRSIGAISADPSDLEQVILNLAVNARDAMPAGGRLSIQSCATTHQFNGKPQNCVLLMVADNGEGIDAGVLEHIFEPFFTTKTEGKGTGLGLATVRSIIERYGGRIEVESRRGQGTCFRIFLPSESSAAIASGLRA